MIQVKRTTKRIRKTVAGIFRIGQLVKLVSWHTTIADLYNISCIQVDSEQKTTGNLKPGDVALVVAVLSTDARAIYIIGPNGAGWISGGLLNIVNTNI